MDTRIPTYSGGTFDIYNPRAIDIDVEDIARGLANRSRFVGRTAYYSVAQHSVEMAQQAQLRHDIEAARWCLFHDAAEAYTFDCARPFKQGLGWVEWNDETGFRFISYETVECQILHAVAEKFNLPLPITPAVGIFDNRALATERRDILTPKQRNWWACDFEPFEQTIYPCSPEFAFQLFMHMYGELFS